MLLIVVILAMNIIDLLVSIVSSIIVLLKGKKDKGKVQNKVIVPPRSKLLPKYRNSFAIRSRMSVSNDKLSKIYKSNKKSGPRIKKSAGKFVSFKKNQGLNIESPHSSNRISFSGKKSRFSKKSVNRRHGLKACKISVFPDSKLNQSDLDLKNLKKGKFIIKNFEEKR